MTRVTANYHVLDSRQPNSTGPVNLYTPYPGAYILKFQAPINITRCNMLPNTTEMVEMAMLVRSALHKGAPDNGWLDGGISLTNFIPQAQRYG